MGGRLEMSLGWLTAVLDTGLTQDGRPLLAGGATGALGAAPMATDGAAVEMDGAAVALGSAAVEVDGTHALLGGTAVAVNGPTALLAGTAVVAQSAGADVLGWLWVMKAPSLPWFALTCCCDLIIWKESDFPFSTCTRTSSVPLEAIVFTLHAAMSKA